jgi:hypothetical protein
MHFEVCICSSVIRSYPLLPSTDQFINQRLHVHTHFNSRVWRNYERHDYVLSLKAYAGGDIDGDNKHGPTCVRGNNHSIGIEPIYGQRNTYITSLFSFLTVNDFKVFPCFIIVCMHHLVRIVLFAIFVTCHLFRRFLVHE